MFKFKRRRRKKTIKENKMAGENVSNNLGNGNVPTATQPETQKVQPPPTESILTTFIMTIYDVVVFLAVSIGYILQVSIE